MISGRAEHVDLMRSVALLAPLSLTAVERLARSAEFYIVDEGELSVWQGGTEIRRLGPGDC